LRRISIIDLEVLKTLNYLRIVSINPFAFNDCGATQEKNYMNSGLALAARIPSVNDSFDFYQ
jgi:hypothetical protein